MSTFTFTTITTGRIDIDAGTFKAAPDSSGVVLTWDKANRVSLGFLGITLNIDATKDTVVIDGTSHAPNFYTGATLYSTLVSLFPKANTGSGGSGSTTDASQLTSGTLNDNRLSVNVTKQGNNFNGNSQLVQTTAAGKLPAIDGSLLINLPSTAPTTDASQLTSGTLPDARLSGNITKNLVPTAIKTSAYTAQPNDLVLTDATAGNVPIALPTAPADKTRVGIKMIGVSGSNTTPYTTGGSDVLNKAGGSTSASLSLLNQSAILQYNSATGIWSVTSADIPLSQLDLRFGTLAQTSANTSAIAAIGGINKTNLLAEYRFDEGSGTTLTDYSGNGNTGTYVGSPTFIAGGGFTASGSTKYATGTNAAIATAQTIYMVADVDADGSSIYHPILGNSGGLTNLNITQRPTANIEPFPCASIVANGSSKVTTHDVTTGMPYIIAITIDTNDVIASKIYLDGTEVKSYSAQSTGVAPKRLGTPWFGATGSTGVTGAFNANIYYFSSYSTLHTPQQILANYNAIRIYLLSRGTVGQASLNAASVTNQLMGVGDSIMFGFSATAPISLVSTTLTFAKLTKGFPGIRSDQLMYSVAGFSSLYHAPLAGWNIVVLLIGANDYSTRTPQQTMEAMQNMSTRLKRQGWKVIVCTLLDRGDAGSVAFQAYFPATNALIRANWRRFADELCDLNAEPLLGASGASANTTYFQSDKIHPTTTGDTLIAAYMSAAINRLTASYSSESTSNPQYLQAVAAGVTVTNTTTETSTIGFSATQNSAGIQNLVLVGATTNTSTTISGLPYTKELVVGMGVSGTGIPAGATISSITNSTSIVISAAATATATAINITFSKLGVKANWWTPGKSVKIEQKGLFSTDAAPGTLNRKVKWGSVVLASTGAQTLPASITNLPYKMEVEITCISIGTSGTFWVQGELAIQSAANAAYSIYPLSNTAIVTIDTTADVIVDITDTFSVASVNNKDFATNLVITERN